MDPNETTPNVPTTPRKDKESQATPAIPTTPVKNKEVR